MTLTLLEKDRMYIVYLYTLKCYQAINGLHRSQHTIHIYAYISPVFVLNTTLNCNAWCNNGAQKNITNAFYVYSVSQKTSTTSLFNISVENQPILIIIDMQNAE